MPCSKAFTLSPKWVFGSSFERKVAIDFPDLHVMFRREKLDINLVTIWSM
jgi:hypothetical protein